MRLVQISRQLRGLQADVKQVLDNLEAAKQGKVDYAFHLLKHRGNFKPESRKPMLEGVVKTLGEVWESSLREVRKEIDQNS